MYATLHLSRHGPLLELQLSGIHHGPECAHKNSVGIFIVFKQTECAIKHILTEAQRGFLHQCLGSHVGFQR